MSMEEMIEKFDIDGISKSPSIFDETKMRWLNGEYLKEMPFEQYYEMAKNYNLPDLSYKTLFRVPRLKDEFEFNELLTYAEQAMIESYQPKFNHIAARPSRKENLKRRSKK